MRNYQGMTLIGMVLTMAVVVMVGILVMRVVPVYLEHYSILSSISALEKLPASEFSTDPLANAHVLQDKLANQLYVNSIVLPPEDIKIVPKGENRFLITIKYQVIKSLFANASLLFVFDESQEVAISAR